MNARTVVQVNVEVDVCLNERDTWTCFIKGIAKKNEHNTPEEGQTTRTSSRVASCNSIHHSDSDKEFICPLACDGLPAHPLLSPIPNARAFVELRD